VAGALAGLTGRPSTSRVEAVNSEPKRIRENEVGMASNQKEGGRHAQEWKRAHVQQPAGEGGAQLSLKVELCCLA
jgi:hypothetical protein